MHGTRTRRIALMLALALLVPGAAWVVGGPAPAPPAALRARRSPQPLDGTAAAAPVLRALPRTASSRDAAPGPGVQTASPVVESGWTGHAYASSDQTPPDVEVAAGPSDIVETVNSHMDVYSRAGVLAASFGLPSFFLSPSDYVTDPQVRYDAARGRWFATVTDGTTGQALIAVSQTGDPTGSWFYYAAPGNSTTNCPDQPFLGVGPVNVIVTVNWFSNLCSASSSSYEGAQVWIINKTALVQGASSPAAWVSAPNANDFSIHPVRIEGAGPDYMVSTYWPGTALTSTVMQLFTVTGSPPGTVTVLETDLPMPLAALAPGAAEPGTSYLLDPGDIRVADAAWAAGNLWLALDESCASGGPTPTPCIRFMEINTNTHSIAQEFDLSSPTRAYFYPALAMDRSGNLAVVFGFSSASEDPGILATGRLAGDAAGYLQPPVLVKAGTGAETTWCYSGLCRYGDYFGASPDPVDPQTLWLAGEFGQGPGGWGTYLFSARVKALITIQYSVQGGPAPPVGPSIHYVLDGAPVSAPLAAPTTSVAVDPGSAWSLDANFTNASGLARYAVLPAEASLLGGIANRSFTESVTYQAQFLVLVTADSPGALALVAGGGWVDGGAVAPISAGSNASWRFEAWVGVGNGSYSGPLATAALTVTGPVIEVAAFDPALTIVAGAGGSVHYAFGTSAGTVPGGSSETIFVPLGSVVNLTAEPSSFLNAFASWEGASTAATPRVSVTVLAPSTVTSVFSVSLIAVLVIGVTVAAAAALVIVLLWRRRRKPAAQPPGFPPPPAPTAPVAAPLPPAPGGPPSAPPPGPP